MRVSILKHRKKEEAILRRQQRQREIEEAEAIAEGVEQFGGKATLFNTNDEDFTIEELRKYDAAAFGSPEYYNYTTGGLQIFIDDLYKARKTNREGLVNKPYGLF